MGQQNSNLSKLCCNNNLCNYDNNVENLTEVNKRNHNMQDDSVFKQNSRTNANMKNNINQQIYYNPRIRICGQDPNESIDVLNDKNKRQQIKNAFEGQDQELKARLIKLAPSAPKLELTVVSSATLQKGMKIDINAVGIQSHPTQRGIIDGIVYFGRKKSVKKGTNDPNAETTSKPKQIVNDFVIPSKNPQTAEQQRGRHFQIKFEQDGPGYYIKDLGIGHGVFVKQEGPTVLKDNMIINVGEAHIVVNLLKDQGDEYDSYQSPNEVSRLKLKIFGGPSSGEIFYFKNEGQEIIIGRTPNCDIRIDDKLLSKTQAHNFYYHILSHIKCIEGNWILIDGYNSKPSTNGTWLYLNEDYEIFDEMVFKANQTIFSVRVI